MTAAEMNGKDRRSRAYSRSKSVLLWCALAFACGQCVVAFIATRTHPEIHDPEYGYNLVRLRALKAAAPDRPLFLILGSSRTLAGIAPPALPPWPAEAGREPLVFNFSLLGTGPVRELLILRRLLAAGFRPDWLLVEVWPPYLPQQGYWIDEWHIMQKDLRLVDLPIVARYFAHRRDALDKLVAEDLVPIAGLRANILARCAASLLSPDQRVRELNDRFWRHGESTGWHPWPERGTPEDFRARNLVLQQQTKPCLDDFSISDTADRALREILRECRRHNTKAALILMPEHGEMRGWYTPSVHEKVNAYLNRLSEQHHVPVIDTRDWVPDEGFHDLNHMAHSSAAPYTVRLGREVLLPWLTGQSSPPHAAIPASGGR